jgi:phage shock protein PspC (stress-responsive transcriptional regulator)
MKTLSVTVQLHRSTLQLDDASYARLRSYLDESASLLEGDPDPEEILNDLEQAVADQCARRMAPGQSVVTLAELEPALAEIGTVQAPGAPEAATPATPGAPRPLQQISEGAVISGVCLGLGRYFGLNVTALRIFAVLLLLVSGGGVVFVYLALMLLLPYAPLTGRGPAPGWLPTKSRSVMEYLRARLHLAPS